MDPLGYSFQTPGWTVRIRNFLSQFSDLFSEYGQYIAPTYHHDRCERSVQMRLYTLNKRQFVLVFATFFVCFGITVLIGVAGPPITQKSEQNASDSIPAPQDLKTGPFILKSPIVSTFHQQLWLIARIDASKEDDGVFSQPFLMDLRIKGVLEDNKSDMVYSGLSRNRSRKLECSKKCEEVILMHLGYLNYPYYIITVHFYGLEHMSYAPINNIKFEFQSYNPSFTQLEIWFRFVFLVLTFLATCMFAHSLRKFSLRDWSIEQKWMSVLLPLLLLYNNPVFPLTFLMNSWIPGMFDGVFQATFLCALLLFWLCLYHGVRQNKRKFATFYLPKLVIVGLIWMASVVMATWLVYNELQDPTYNYRLDTGNFFALKVIFFVIGGIYLLYLVFLLVRAYAELKSMPYFDLRLKFLTFLMLVVLAISIAITVLRFGGNVMKDNFVAELSTHYQNSAEFLSFYGLLNFYLYTMAYVYSPSKNAVFESHFKDNPALSMLNDSDDDVVYGSESDEQTSLSRKQANVYDSDEEAFN